MKNATVPPSRSSGPRWIGWALIGLFVLVPGRLVASTQAQDGVNIRLIDVDVRSAVQALAPYIDRPVVFGAIGDGRVTIETPGSVQVEQVIDLLRGALTTQSLELIDEDALYRIERVEPEPPPEPEPEPAPPEFEAGAIELHVVHLKHARAADVAATVNALYGRGGSLGELGAPIMSLTDQLRDNLVDPLGSARQVGPASVGAGAFEGVVTIVPDAGTNSLLVRASAADYELIFAAVQELDVRPLQVMIEVVITEVQRDKNLSFGLETILPPYQPDPNDDATISGRINGLDLGEFVLGILQLGNLDLGATLRAAASRGQLSILSRPIVIAANNESASFVVGSERPFVQVSRSLPTDSPQRDQVVQFKEVGTRLVVTPTISADGYVMLDIIQEVNSATDEVQFDAPVISTRTVETQLLVKDGHTAVLGGLTETQESVIKTGVPVLSAIPLLGGLFGREVKRNEETEFFLFLTPRIIRDDADLDAATRSVPERSLHAGEILEKSGWLPAISLPDSTKTDSKPPDDEKPKRVGRGPGN